MKTISAKDGAERARIEKQAEKEGKPFVRGSDMILPKEMQIEEDEDGKSFDCIAEGTIRENTSRAGDKKYWSSQMSHGGSKFSIIGAYELNPGEPVKLSIGFQRDAQTKEVKKTEAGYYLYTVTVKQGVKSAKEAEEAFGLKEATK